MKQKILAVVGPTASGKTSLAIRLAQLTDGEVVSSDSMQIYRRMQIGTAAPTVEEMQGIPHHMIAVADPDEAFSCADYTERARACIEEIASRGKTPILCGGTGLYLDSLLWVSSFSEAPGSDEIRQKLQNYADEHGVHALHRRLTEADPESAASIHENNVRRVIRALEIYETTGITKTEWDRRSLAKEPRYDAKITVLDFCSRSLLYERIDLRVTLMLQAGLVEEVRRLYDEGLLDSRYVASQAIGYKEFFPYFAGDISLDEAAEQIRLSSRRYAKRQLTWFRRYTDALWLHPDENGLPLRTADELAQAVLQFCAADSSKSE